MRTFGRCDTLVSTLALLVALAQCMPHNPCIDKSDKKDSVDYVERNRKTVQSIYNQMIYPRMLEVVQRGAKAVPKGIFAENVLGRITPVGNFTGFEDSVEYFVGLAPVPSANPVGMGFHRADMTHFSSECPTIASSVVQLRTASIDSLTGRIIPNKLQTTLKQIAFWKFNNKGEVIQFDAWLPNIQQWLNAGLGIDFSNRLIQTAVPFQLCPTIQERCQGSNAQFSNTASCVMRMENKAFGTFDNPWGDNIVCRNIHLALTLMRPDIHCPHVGPAGGNGPDNWKCVDTDYNHEYTDEKGMFGSKSPFMCES